MKVGFRLARVWIPVVCSLVVGAAFLIAWHLAHDRWPAGTVFVPGDAANLELALSRVREGGTIVLDARRGPYSGSVSVGVPDVTIRSRSGRAVLTSASGTVLDIAADGVNVSGIALEGAGTGISVHASNCRIHDVTVTSFAVGLDVASGTHNTVEGVTIRGGRVGADVAAPGTRLGNLVLSDQAETGVLFRNADACAIIEATFASCPIAISIEDCADARFSDLRIAGADTCIDVSGGTGTTVARSSFSTSRVGIRFNTTEAARVEESGFRAITEAGVLLVGTKQTAVLGSCFDGCGTGVRASGGDENSIGSNRLSRSLRSSIVVESERDDLIVGNVVRDGDIGISLDHASSVQVSRNHVDGARLVGILIDQSEGDQVLDNTARRCAMGIAAVASSSVTVERNSIADAAAAGIALVNGTLGNSAAQNRIAVGGQGILLAGSSRDAVTENSLSACVEGLSLCRIGFGTVLEGNDVSSCDVGLSWNDTTPGEDSPLARLGFHVERTESTTAPIVVDNSFRSCRTADVANSTGLSLLAGGNQWSASVARVQGRVDVPESGWKTTIALGSARSTVDLVLGSLLEWMLVENGVRVVDLVGLGSSEDLVKALDGGDAGAAWWTGDAAPAVGAELWEIPARRGWSLIARADVATAVQGGKTSVSIAVPDAVGRDAALRSLESLGLTAATVKTVDSSVAAEGLLKFGTVDCAILDRLEETVTLSGCVTLGDGSSLPSSEIGLLVREANGAAEAALRAAFDRLRPHLTEETLKNLVSRVRLLGREPLDVAMEYLLREGLIGDEVERGAG